MAPSKPPVDSPLADAIRTSGRKRPKVKRLPKQIPPDAIALSYFAALKKLLLRDIQSAVKEHIIPALKDLPEPKTDGEQREDASVMNKVHQAIERAAKWVAARWTNRNARKVIAPYAQRTADYSRKQLANQLKAAIGVDVTLSEPWLQAEIDAWISSNVSLIKSVHQGFFADIEKRVGEMVHSGERWETLAAEIEDRMGVSKSRAALIARTETGKIYSQINRKRMESLGIQYFTWQTANDNRVRDSHHALQGKRFRFSEFPEDKMPGMEPNCRCSASPDVDHAFNELFPEEE